MNTDHPGVFIDGQFVDGEHPLTVVNPASEAPVGTVSAASHTQILRAIGSARRSFDHGKWAATATGDRVAVLLAMLDYFAANADSIRKMAVKETGCPIGAPVIAAQFDLPLRGCRDYLAYFLRQPEFEQNPVPVMERIAANGAFVESLKRHVPIGVVAAISAYNFPFFFNIWKVVSALMTGNSVILRPSPLTPYAALVFGHAAMAAGLPAGVLGVVVDAGHEGGVTLTSHPDVDMVSFTGSSAIGERVAAQASSGLKRLQLELGGKSAQIYMPDRLDAARTSALSVVLSHAGQGCVLGTRVLVPSESKAEILEAMAASVRDIVIGDPTDPKTQMGPVVSAAQRERCERYVAASVAAGGRIVAGGKRPSNLERGYYFEPTILDVPDNANPAAQDEIFGPVVCVIGYDSIDHAVEIANDTRFGLSGYVYGKDLRRAIAVAERIRTGTINVNSGGLSAYASSGGFGISGIGRERGIEGIRIYQQMQTMNVSN